MKITNNIQSKNIKVGSLNIRYFAGGQGEPLVIIHGGGDGARAWLQNAEELSRHYSVYIPDLPGFDFKGVMALKNLEDGRRIKQFIRDYNVKRVVIIGMGYIALEMGEALRARDIEVDMVKPRPAFLPWLHENLAHMIKEEIEANEVNIHPGHALERIEKTETGLRVVCTDLELEGQMVLVAIGVKPNNRLAEKAGIVLGPNRAIAVDRTLLTWS